LYKGERYIARRHNINTILPKVQTRLKKLQISNQVSSTMIYKPCPLCFKMVDTRKLRNHMAQLRAKGHEPWKTKIQVLKFLHYLGNGDPRKEAMRKSLSIQEKPDKAERLEK